MDYLNGMNQIWSLIQKIRKMEFNNIGDILKTDGLSEIIYEEWLKLRTKFRTRIYVTKINDGMLAEYEIVEEILISLLPLLNKKIINFMKISKLE